jgi:hypothetical protein
MCCVTAAVFAGCAGAGRALLPGGQDQRSALTAAQAPTAFQMDATYPKSVSPGSLPLVPMPQTALLSARAMRAAPQLTKPKSIGALAWEQLTGAATSIAIAPDGSIWVLSNDPAGINKFIWHWSKGTWTNISGAASSIAVGPTGTLYAVNGTTKVVSAYAGSSWSSLGGGARAVAVGADGSVYVTSDAGIVNGNSAVWKYANGGWIQMPGSGSGLAGSFDATTYTVAGVGTIAPNGFFLVTAQGAYDYYSPGTGYVQLPGAVTAVAPVPGGFFSLKYPAPAGNDPIAYFDYGSAGATAESGSGVSIAAGPGTGGVGTQLGITNATDAIWTTSVATNVSTPAFNDYPTFGYDNAHDAFNPNSTSITPATVSSLHLVWQTALDNGSDFGTQTQPTLATEISGHSGVLFVGGSAGNMYAYDATTGALIWTRKLGQMAYSCGSSGGGVLGVGGTAAYDPATRSIYVVGNLNTTTGA